MKKELLYRKFKGLLQYSFIFNGYCLLKAFQCFFSKIVTGSKALKFYVKWLVREKKQLYLILNDKYSIDKIKVYRPLFWKHCVKYFIGTCSNEEFFVKTSGKIDTTKREITALRYCYKNSEFLKKRIPCLAVNCFEEDHLIIEKKIQGISLSALIGDLDSIESQLVEQIFQIYCELRRINVKHLDIRPENFLISYINHQIKVYLIDFGFALVNSDNVFDLIEENDYSKKIINRLGSNYSLRNNTFDDAYSTLMTLKAICPSLIKKYPSIWRELNDDIGERTVIIHD